MSSVRMCIKLEASAHEAWKRLETMHVNKTLHGKILARNALYTVKMRAGESMHEYATRVEELGETFMDLGGTVTEEDWILTLLCGLPEEWGSADRDSVGSGSMGSGALNHEDVESGSSGSGSGRGGMYACPPAATSLSSAVTSAVADAPVAPLAAADADFDVAAAGAGAAAAAATDASSSAPNTVVNNATTAAKAERAASGQTLSAQVAPLVAHEAAGGETEEQGAAAPIDAAVAAATAATTAARTAAEAAAEAVADLAAEANEARAANTEQSSPIAASLHPLSPPTCAWLSPMLAAGSSGISIDFHIIK
ncbi:unnamed protein product [Closterium sp. NIES-54]